MAQFHQYKLTNQLGTVYKNGNLVFSADGQMLYAPVGNKITRYNLQERTTHTLGIEVAGNFSCLALSPNDLILLGVAEVKLTNGNTAGCIHVISTRRSVVMSEKSCAANIKNIAFSPDGKKFAVSAGNEITVFNCDGLEIRLVSPIRYCNKYMADAEVLCLDWSFDSRFLAYGCSNSTVSVVWPKAKKERIHIQNKKPVINSQSQPVMGVFFMDNSYDLYVVNKVGFIVSFTSSIQPKELIVTNKDDETCEYAEKDFKIFTLNFGQKMPPDYIITDAETKDDEEFVVPSLSGVAFHKKNEIFVNTFSDGRFYVIHAGEEMHVQHRLKCSSMGIGAVAMNASGAWVALGVPRIGQLIVWDLVGECYLLQQQGHHSTMTVATYSPDGASIASGGVDGKVKLWATDSSFCYKTFSEHSDDVTGIVFTQSGRALISASLDGTVRAYDTARHQMFRTLTSDRKSTQFTCVSVDSQGDMVAAGAQDDHKIYLWSLQKKLLYQVLDMDGHQGPVCAVMFSPKVGSSMLASTSIDQTLIMWDCISDTQDKQVVHLQSDGISLSIRPDGKQVCVATGDGHLTFFGVESGEQEGQVDGRLDLGEKGYFQSVQYQLDGRFILAGGVSKFVCAYSVQHQVLVKRWEITRNTGYQNQEGLVFQGWREKKQAARKMRGLEVRTPKHDRPSKAVRQMPGSQKGDMSKRDVKHVISVSDIGYSPSGSSFAVCCSEGMLVYSRHADWLFDPVAINEQITPATIKKKLAKKEWNLALMMALKLNIDELKQEAFESIPIDGMDLLITSLPASYLKPLLDFLGKALGSTRHVGFYVHFTSKLLRLRATHIFPRAPQLTDCFNALHRAMGRVEKLVKLADDNIEDLSFLLANTVAEARPFLTQYDAKAVAASDASGDENKEDVLGAKSAKKSKKNIDHDSILGSSSTSKAKNSIADRLSYSNGNETQNGVASTEEQEMQAEDAPKPTKVKKSKKKDSKSKKKSKASPSEEISSKNGYVSDMEVKPSNDGELSDRAIDVDSQEDYGSDCDDVALY